MSSWSWRIVERWLRRALPADRAASVVGELAEDYAQQRHQRGAVRAQLWLLREGRSLAVAYRQQHLQSWIVSVLDDASSAMRAVSRRPWRSIAAAGILGLAVGLTTAMFTLADSLIFRPVPFPDADRLATATFSGPRGGPAPPMSVFNAWHNAHVFEAIEGASEDYSRVDLSGVEVHRRVARVTPGIFAMLGGVRPIVGRLFDADDGLPGREHGVLMSEEIWRAQYAADPNIVGHHVEIEDRRGVLIGILPSAFRFPSWSTAFWEAERFDASLGPDAGAPQIYVKFARTIPEADALRTATTIAKDADPRRGGDRQARATRLDDWKIDRSYLRAAPVLAIGILLLFVVLCANVSSLQLAGMSARRLELATRAALGASRARLVRRSLLESAMAGAAGVLIGAGLAEALVEAARVWLIDPLGLHSLNVLDIDARALAATAAAGLVATLSSSFLPALIGTRVDGQSLQVTSRTATEPLRARLTARALLVGQIAVSCALLVGAALLARSFVNLVRADRGFDASRILTVRVDAPSKPSGGDSTRLAAMRAVSDEALALPGVTKVAWSYFYPPYGTTTFSGDWTSDAPGSPRVTMDVYDFRVSAAFFDMYGIPILRGRAFLPSDPPSVVLVSERVANIMWPGLDPVGRGLWFGSGRLSVIGVVKDIRFPSVDRSVDAPQIYGPFGVVTTMGVLSLRCEAACPDTEFVHQRLEHAQSGMGIYAVSRLDATYLREFNRPRAAAGLAGAFAITALVAAAAGLFSLLSQVVARRRREFGIRTALGASADDIRRLIARDGAAIAATGTALGAIAAILTSRLIGGMLFNVSATDPVSWSAVIGTLTLAVAAASWSPARAAGRTNPVILLRDE